MTSLGLTTYKGFREHNQGLDEERISLRQDIKALLYKEGAEFDLIKHSHAALRKYPNLASLKSRIKYPEVIAKANVSDLTPLIQDLEGASRTTDQTTKDILQNLANYYREFQQQLDEGSEQIRAVLLSPKAEIEGDLIGPYRIPQDVAYKLLSRNQYGDIIRSNVSGNHPVVAVGGLHLKSATENEPLDTAMEIGVYLLHSLLFGKEIGPGLAPSSLLMLDNVVIDEPATPLIGKEKELFENAVGSNRRGSFIRRHKCPVISSPQTYHLQASKTIEGQRLDEVLDDPDFDSISWNEENFSALILASFLTIPSDNKPDNFIVVMDNDRLVAKIIGIDNDMAFAYPMTVIGQEKGHLIGLKNALLCFDKMMKKPIDPKVRKRIAKLDPIQFGIEWAAAVKQQEQRYPSQKTNQVNLPLLFTKDTLHNLIENLHVLQKIASNPDFTHVTHRELFRLLFPVVERYYQGLAKSTKSTSKRIENLFSPGLPTVEEYLKDSFKKNERLEDNRTIKEALVTSQKGIFAYQKERNTPVEEECSEVLRTMDLSLLSPEKQCAIFSIAASIFPEVADKNVHASWRSDTLPFMLIHSQDCGHIIPFLQKLGVNLQAQNKDGDTLLHLWLKQEKNPPKELLKCIDLKTPNKMGLTPLDIAMDHKLSDITIALIDAGAGATASSSRAWEFYTNVVKTKQDPHLTEAFQRLVRRNQTISWKMAKEIILPSKGDGKVVVRSALNGERKLHPVAEKQLFKEDGSIKAVNTTGRRAVGKATIDGFTLYFKEAPELPGVEQAVGTFIQQVMGFGAPHTDLVRINGIPYLISQEIPGPTLQEILESNPEQLRQLDKKCLSQLLLMTMLINFEDGKPDNYIVEPTPYGGFRIVSIDNDHAFVPSVAKETLFGNRQNRVQVKTILYCLDQMKDPIEPSVREQFLLHDPAMILMAWLRHLSNIHDLYTKLFDEDERRLLFNNSGVFVGIPFRQEMVTNLYRKMVKMQFLLDQQKNNAKFSHMDLLSTLDQPLGDRYLRGFKKQQNPMDRFLEIDGKDYEIKGKNIISTRHAKEILQSYNITTMADIQALIQKGEALDVEGALRELQDVVNKDQNALVLRHLAAEGVNVDFASVKVDQMAAILRRLDFSKIPPHVVQSILNQIRRYVWKELRLPYSPMVTNAYLRGLNFSDLNELDLTDCQSLTDQVVGQILGQAPQLKKLNLSKNNSFEKIQGGYWGQGTPLQMNKVSHLYLNHCPNLNTLAIAGNELVHVQCEGNNLMNLAIQSPSLSNLSLINNKRLTDEALRATTEACDNLKRLDLEGCDQISEKELKMKYPTYPFHLLANCSPKLKRLIFRLLTNDIEELIGSYDRKHIKPSDRPFRQTRFFSQYNIWSDEKLREKEYAEQQHQLKASFWLALKLNSSLKKFQLSAVPLILENERYFYLSDEEIKMIIGMLKVNTTWTYLDISNYAIGSDGAFVLADSLLENKTLNELRIENRWIPAREGLRAIFDALQVNKTLNSLSLGKVPESSAVVIADFLKSNATLSSLELEIVDEKALSIIFRALQFNTFLRKLKLRNIGDKKAISIAIKGRTQAIEEFLKFNRDITISLEIDEDERKLFFDVLKRNPSSATLFILTLNNINQYGFKTSDWIFNQDETNLADILESNQSVVGLSLNGTKIDVICLKTLSQALTINKSLKQLKIASNISSEGAAALASTLDANTPLTELDISNNKIGDEGVIAITNSLKKNKSLVKLRLHGNSISDKGVKALAETLHLNSSLEELSLEVRSIKDEGAKALAKALEANTSLKVLGLNGFSIEDEYKVWLEIIFSALKLNRSIRELHFHEENLHPDITILMKKMGFVQSSETEFHFTRNVQAVGSASSAEGSVSQEISFPSSFSYSKHVDDSDLPLITPETLFTQAKVLEKTDLNEAIDRYLEAAIQKHPEALKRLQELSEISQQAQYALGSYYEEQNNLSQAAVLYARGAAGAHMQAKQALYRFAENDPIAQSQLAILLENGIGMKQNISEALILHKKATDKGIGLSTLHLGVLYHMGYSTEANKALALSLIDQAASQGVLQANIIKAQIQKDILEKELLIQKAASDDQALFLLATKKPGTDLFSLLPFLNKEAFANSQGKINKAEAEALQREVEDILQSIEELEKQAISATSTQFGLFRKRIEGLREKLTDLQKQQKVQLDHADDARKFLLNEKRKLFYCDFYEKVSNILQAVNAILADQATRNTSLKEHAASAVVKGAMAAIDIGMNAAASVIPFAGMVLNITTYALEAFLKHKKNEEIKDQCRKIQGYYPDNNVKGVDKLSTLLTSGLVYRFQDHLPHLNGESLDGLAKYFVLSFTDHLTAAPKDASVYELIVGGSLTKLSLKDLFVKKSLVTNDGMEWAIDDLLFSTGVCTIYGGKYLPKDPKRRNFIKQMEKNKYPIYRWGTKEEIDKLKNMGIEMECIEEERIGALATNIDPKKAAARYMLEAKSLVHQFTDENAV